MIRRFVSLGALAVAAVASPILSHAQAVDVNFPLNVGLWFPLYDRVNGLTLPFGPTITFGDERVVVEPLVAYRSNLGKFDPSLRTKVKLDTLFSLSFRGERGTFSNERWIRSDFKNSLWSLAFGRDSRNYYRADRGEARVNLRLATEQLQTNASIDFTYFFLWKTLQLTLR